MQASYLFWKSVPEDVRNVVLHTFGTRGGHKLYQAPRGLVPDACPIGVALVVMTNEVIKGNPRPGQAVTWLKEAGVKNVTSDEVCRFINANDALEIADLAKAMCL